MITKTAEQLLHHKLYEDHDLGRVYTGDDKAGHAEKLKAYLDAHDAYKKNTSKWKRFGPGVAAYTGGIIAPVAGFIGSDRIANHYNNKIHESPTMEEAAKYHGEGTVRSNLAALGGMVLGSGLSYYGGQKAKAGVEDMERRKKAEKQLADLKDQMDANN